jgi:hypothetical protein
VYGRLPIACSLKELGELGILDLKIMGFALRLCWEWLQGTDANAMWVVLPSNGEPMVQTMFHASIIIRIGDGSTTVFLD